MSSRSHAHGLAERVHAALARVARAELFEAPSVGAELGNTPGAAADEPLETMLRALKLTKGNRVLEVGSRRGRETAVLCELAREVVSLVGTSEEAEARRRTLAELGYKNFKIVVGKNASAALEDGPYQAVLVAAAAVQIPARLLDMLEADGRLVIPLGDVTGQVIELVTRRGTDVQSEVLCPCHLPMLHGAGGRPSFFPWNG
jgi:protein-L-isoaspartate(D-aspartate) O-methyltransferase